MNNRGKIMKMYHVDAFTSKLFAGNPADVCVMQRFPDDQTLQNIAKENRLSETAYVVKTGVDKYDLRWFTPGGEIDLCGHATLATGFVIFQYYQPQSKLIRFETKSGELTVGYVNGHYQMNFPSYQLKEIAVTEEMTKVFGVKPLAAYQDRDLLCILPHASDVINYQPDGKQLAKLPGLLQNITAASDDPKYDSVSRCFAPKLDVLEDPVTGSSHCQIVPYWSQKLGKKQITAFQASPRTGVLYCEDQGKRVLLSGDAALYSVGELKINY